MNKLITCLFFVSVLFSGCQKKIADTILGKTPDERLSAYLAAYQQKLTASANGWILVEFANGQAINQGATTNGPAAAFAYYMQFSDSNRVTMFSDFDTSMATTPKSSGYRIKAVQRPSLIFDTYSYIHIPCDPDPAISRSPFGAGLGWGTDFEFSFADNADPAGSGDTIHLTGNLNGASAMLIRATKEQHDAYFNGGFANGSFIFNRIFNYFKRLRINGKDIEFTPSLSRRSIDVSWLDGRGQLRSLTTNYFQVANGIYFTSPVNTGSLTFSSLQNIMLDASSATATVTVNGNGATMAGSIAPLKNDTTAPDSWYNTAASAGYPWIAHSGFHIDGVDDALALQQLAYNGYPFYAYLYYPKVFSAGYDLVSPFFYSAAGGTYPDYYTAAFEQTIGGIGYFGTIPLFITPAPVTNTENTLADPNGYYFILKEDHTSYDMVSAGDAKSWITWQNQ